MALLLDAHSGRIVSERGWRNGRSSTAIRGSVCARARARERHRDVRRSRGGGAAGADGRIIEIGDYGDPQANIDFAAWAKFANVATGRPVIKADDPASLLAAIRDAYNEGTPDVLIYANGH